MAWGFQHCFAQPRREMFNESREYSLMLSDGGGPAAGQQVSERQGGESSAPPDWCDLFSILVALFSETSGGSQGQAGRQNHFSAWSPSAGSERSSRKWSCGGRRCRSCIPTPMLRSRLLVLHPHTHAPQQAMGPASPAVLRSRLLGTTSHTERHAGEPVAGLRQVRPGTMPHQQEGGPLRIFTLTNLYTKNVE